MLRLLHIFFTLILSNTLLAGSLSGTESNLKNQETPVQSKLSSSEVVQQNGTGLIIAFPGITLEDSACLAVREVIPYSPYEQMEAYCGGKNLEVTSLFGRNLVQKFKAHIKPHGYKVIATLGKSLVISKNSKEELEVNELCKVIKISYLQEFSFTCENSIGWSLKSTKDADLQRYLKSQNFRVLNSSNHNNGIYIVGR